MERLLGSLQSINTKCNADELHCIIITKVKRQRGIHIFLSRLPKMFDLLFGCVEAIVKLDVNYYTSFKLVLLCIAKKEK